MRCAVSPFPLVEAVGGWEELQRVDAEVDQVGLAAAQYGEFGEIGAAEPLVNQCGYVQKGGRTTLRHIQRTAKRLGRGHFVNDELIVRRELVRGVGVSEDRSLPAGVGIGQLAASEIVD